MWSQAVSYAYDLNGNRTEARLNAVINAAYGYDALNRLTQLTDAGSGVTAFGYDTTSKLTSRTTPSGVAAAYTYDGLDRLTRLKHTKGAATVADYQYQQNAVGNITQLTEQTGAHVYGYDSVDRLTSATHPTQPAESYAYDGVGNRTSSHRASTYNYQPFNKAVTVGTTSYSYDANGNLTSKTDATGTWQYVWDYGNRLTQVTKPDGQIVTYKYDALGRRVERAKGGVWMRFTYDGADVVLDRNNDGSTVEYTNGLGIDEKLSQCSNGGGALYFVQDHLGSTRALTDSAGNIVEQISYWTVAKVFEQIACSSFAHSCI